MQKLTKGFVNFRGLHFIIIWKSIGNHELVTKMPVEETEKLKSKFKFFLYSFLSSLNFLLIFTNISLYRMIQKHKHVEWPATYRTCDKDETNRMMFEFHTNLVHFSPLQSFGWLWKTEQMTTDDLSERSFNKFFL